LFVRRARQLPVAVAEDEFAAQAFERVDGLRRLLARGKDQDFRLRHSRSMLGLAKPRPLRITLPAVVPAHSASLRAFTPVFDGLWTRVNALMLGTHIPEPVVMGPRNGVPATPASRGAPRGDDSSTS